MRRQGILARVVAAFACVVAGFPAPCVEQAGLGFVMTAEKAAYRSGESTRVTITWTNLSARTLVIPRWRGPTAGVTSSGHGAEEVRDFSVFYEGKERLAYQGLFACGPTQPLSLEPGEKETQTYDISDSYALSRPGKYVLRTVFFGYGADDPSGEHWKGRIVHPDIEVWILQ
jgi:hypothetical protein